MIFLITDQGFYYEGHVVDELHYSRKYGPMRSMIVRLDPYMLSDFKSDENPAAIRYVYEMWGYNIDPTTEPTFMQLFGGLYVLVCPD